jgi:hypothetical protein
MKRFFSKPRNQLILIISLIIVGVGTFFVESKLRASPIPASFRKSISFPVFLPTAGVTINTNSYKFEPSQKILSFTGYLSDRQLATFTEQATPDPINDLTNFYSQFLQTLNQYAAFDTLNGTVNLTHPNGGVGQAAVMNSKGTLMFVRVANDEPQSVWQPLFNQLKIVST